MNECPSKTTHIKCSPSYPQARQLTLI